jgi:nicotinate dehydrogenase subunit B
MTDSVSFRVNGTPRTLALEPDRSVLSALRNDLGLTGAKPGCLEGACGACTVLLDGRPEHACQVHLSAVAGHSVTTVEGLVREGALHPVQRAFLEVGAMQCGYCTPGMIMRTVALLEQEADPDDDQVRDALDGNVCRCCTYPRILRAVHRASDLIQDSSKGPTSVPVPESGLKGHWSETGRPRQPWDLTRLPDRDYFEVLPDGLIVVAEPDAAGSGWSTSAGAWLHVGVDGAVTAFTGKVDVGQDNRTALSVRVAAELRVPLTAVRLVMGDTDLCPYDGGTFGSRSIPDAGEQLRHAAAGARECLIELAATRWDVRPSELVAVDGSIRSADGHSAAYGDLVHGLRRVEIASDHPRVAPVSVGDQVARRTARLTAVDIVTGAKRYPSDLSRPGMLHGRILRPPAIGATLRSVDVAPAAAMPGVTVVHEGSFVGVAAPDPATAGRAVKAIKAQWDLEPQPSENELVTHLRDHPVDVEGWEGAFHDEVGAPDEALAAAPIRLDATYTTAYIAHVPLETHVALAEWGDGDRLTVWTGTQVPFGVRQELAEGLQIPEAQVRVIVPDTGGGFGGKHAGPIAVEAARLARAVGRPVKVRFSRPEEFTAGYLRPAAVIDVRAGAALDGSITAWEMRTFNAGRFGLVAPYNIPHQRSDYVPADSPLPQGSYRALAATANHFARESHIDALAHALEVDPLDLRLAHLTDERLASVFRAAAERINWESRRSEPGAGVGIAGGIEKGARVATAVQVRVAADRRLEVVRIVTALDCGEIVDREGLLNQIEGATVMGLGGALFEAVHFDEGRITNASMTDYRVPRLSDVPPIEVILLDQPDLPSAGAGETPIIAVAPALANAIFAASGVRLRSLPLVPDGFVP